MSKTILITGATDGIGLETARMLAGGGHTLLLHGRNPEKLAAAVEAVSQIPGAGTVESDRADLSRMTDAAALAGAIAKRHATLDVLINNAGIYGPGSTTTDGLDVRFAVNTIAPYLLTRRLLPLMGSAGRVVNVSSAAQSGVDLDALVGPQQLPDGAAYAQSKLAITMWSAALAREFGDGGPMVVAVNPGSLLGSKMVKDAFGVAGGDLGKGADILTRAALSDAFHDASGKYFDNDSGHFAPPHPDALDTAKNVRVVDAIERVLAGLDLG